MSAVAAVHPQPPDPGRSAALMLGSIAVHGLLLWGLVHYSLRPLEGFEFIRAPEPKAIQVMVISTSVPSPAAQPVHTPVRADPPRPAPPVVSTRSVQAPQPTPSTQPVAPSVAEAPAVTQTPAPAPSVITTSANTAAAVAIATSTEKPAYPPLVQGHPDYAYNPLPDYPMALREKGLGGVVWLRVWVDSDGHPGEIRLSKGSGYRLLDDAALRAVRSWRFVPARSGDQRQSSWVEFPVRFASNS